MTNAEVQAEQLTIAQMLTEVKKHYVQLGVKLDPGIRYNLQRGIDRLDEAYFWANNALAMALDRTEEATEARVEAAVKTGNVIQFPEPKA